MVENITDIGAAESLSFAPAGQTPKQFGSTFFRGDNCNFYPTHADYDTIEGIRTFLLKGWIPSRPALNKYSKITAFGSCFASNITTYLTKIGYDLSRNRDEGVYISSMGEGLVNVHAILQQFEWALKSVIPPTNLWHGFKAEEFGYSEDVRTRTRTIFLNTDFFIITLGLSEIWYDEITGGIFWRAIPMKHYDENRHKFRVCSFQETKDAITSIYRIITEYIPNAKILFTLSPIPLAATFRPSGCIVANSASKSILRAAIDEFCRENEPALNERLFYFPSFEIVNELFYNKFTFDDNRHPHPQIIDIIMKIFETAYCDSGLLWEDVAKRYLAYRFDNVREIANYHCSVNQEVNFTGPINGTGWYGAEPWGRWSDGPRSTIVFRLDGGACRDMSLIGRAKAFLPVADLVQEVTVRANGEEMARWIFSRTEEATNKTAVIPAELIRKSGDFLEISFEIARPMQPSAWKISTDSRHLGIGVLNLSLLTRIIDA